jgi:N-acetylneuraminic acid mutarotase
MKLTIKILLNCIFLLLLSCNSAEESPYPELILQNENLSLIPARATAVSFVIGNNAYIALGRTAGHGSAGYTDIWEYNINTKTATAKADFPGTGRVGAIAEIVDGKAYIGLGFNPEKGVYDATSRLDDFWMYDATNNTWTQKASFPKRTNGETSPVVASVSFVYQKWVYVITDFDTYSFSKEVWRYDTQNDKWEQLKSFPGRHRTGAVLCNNSQRYFFGTGYVVDNMNDWWEYFPATDSWKERKPLPDKGRYNAVAFSVDNRFFVSAGRRFGGTLTDGIMYDDILEYDADKDVWYKRGKLPTGGRENAIAFVLNHKAYIGFGENEGLIYNDLWSFNP